MLRVAMTVCNFFESSQRDSTTPSGVLCVGSGMYSGWSFA
jgi:hypothetical protein